MQLTIFSGIVSLGLMFMVAFFIALCKETPRVAVGGVAKLAQIFGGDRFCRRTAHRSPVDKVSEPLLRQRFILNSEGNVLVMRESQSPASRKSGANGRQDGGQKGERGGPDRGAPKSWTTQKPREDRPVRVDPDSPFAKLAALRDQLKK